MIEQQRMARLRVWREKGDRGNSRSTGKNQLAFLVYLSRYIILGMTSSLKGALTGPEIGMPLLCNRAEVRQRKSTVSLCFEHLFF